VAALTCSRHSGLADRRHQQDEAPPSPVRPTRADEELDADRVSPTDFLNDIYFGDFWGPLRKGYLCCALFQFGGLPTPVREAKEHEFFCILRRYKINLAFLQELGLNWSALSDSQQWR